MKKLIALLIPTTMMLSLLSACASPAAPTTPGTTSPTTSVTSTETTTPPATTGSTTAAATTTPATTAATTRPSSPVGELTDVIEAIYKIKPVEISVQTMPVDLADADAVKYNTGLTSAAKLTEASVSESMIGSQAYSMVLVRVKDSADLESVAKAMKEGIDPRKWICVEADDLRVVGAGDVVMLMMVSTDFKDMVTAEQMTEAFKTVSGGTLNYDSK